MAITTAIRFTRRSYEPGDARGIPPADRTPRLPLPAVGIFRRIPRASHADLALVQQRVDEIVQRIDSFIASQEQATDQVSARIASIDVRVEQVGREVVRQLEELSGDLDRVDERTNKIVADIVHLAEVPQLVEGVRSDQARLAHEQARYEIAFRQDLAELADIISKRRAAG